MVAVFKQFLSVVSSLRKGVEDDDDPNNVEYSFAIEYSGPPVTCNIPRAVPVDVNQIPVAAAVASVASLDDVSLPVIQPIRKSNFSNKRLLNDNPVGVVKNGTSKGNHMSRGCGVDSSSAKACANGEGYGIKYSDGMESSCRFRGTNNHDDEYRVKLSDGIGLSGRLGFCDDYVSSPESSRRVLELPDGMENTNGVFQDYVNANNSELIESESSQNNLTEIFSFEGEDHIGEAPCHVKRPSIVTFRDPESDDVVQDGESDAYASEISVPVRPKLLRPGKEGTCYRCSKGNRFTEKEVCIVCGAKYCNKCVLRAMGSMPEGRKCVSCIGQRIDEAYRRILGKSSRMLKQLLPEFEIKRIMGSERSCAVNQLPPELICVNGKRLSQQELVLLHNCQNPPTKLKPGNYWYDKVSGFWGKEGRKPCQIISPQLNVGGHIQEDASNGNTEIMINNRRITRTELLMLKLAGVKCQGATHFWVSADGTYQEEGMNNVKGNIWKKATTKLICAALSLPSPSNITPNAEEGNGVITSDLEGKKLHKLLLVGCEHSGTTTIFKHAKIVYNVPFSEEERESVKSIIQTNLYGYLGILLEWREQFEEESLSVKRKRFIDQCSPSVTVNNTAQNNLKSKYALGLRLKAFSDWLLQVIMSGNLELIIPAASREYAPLVEELWKDTAIQATYNRRTEIDSLPQVATYFLERAVEIARADYNPSDMDILYAEGIASSKGLSCMEFSFPKSAQDGCEPVGYEHDSSLRYQLIRAHPRILGGNCKWLEMFEDTDIVLFCVSLSDYDDEYPKVSNCVPTNKMMASKQLFESVVTHPTFEEKKFLLILNKFDLLEEKIEQVPLSRCEWFHDFNPVIGHNPNGGNPNGSGTTNPSLGRRAFQYVAMKFKRLFHSLTDRKLYVSLVTGLEPDNIDEALRYAREILKWDQEEPNYPNNELSSASMEASSSS